MADRIIKTSDRGASRDDLGIVVPVVVAEIVNHARPVWSIPRYTEVAYAQAKPYFEEQGFFLSLVKQVLQNSGMSELLERYAQKARLFGEKGEQYAYHTSVIPGNLLLNEGINLFTTLICGGAGNAFSNANAYIGVGDSSNSEVATQTGLQASTNKLYAAMDTGFPTFGTSQQAAWKSTFLSNQANFAWNEFTVANGNSDAATNLNRKVSSQGTKQSGQVWVPTLTIVWA